MKPWLNSAQLGRTVFRHRSTIVGLPMLKRDTSSSSSSYCVDLVKKRDFDHYLTCLVLPPEVRRLGIALRAFNVEVSSVRDTVTDWRLGLARLQFWKDAVNAAFSDAGRGVPHHPVMVELDHCLRSFPSGSISKVLLESIVSSREPGMQSDQPFRTVEDLDKYCEGAFASINLVLLEALSASQSDPSCKTVLSGHARHCANQLGKAEGWANVLRAVPFNAGRKRLYIPAEMLARHKVAAEHIFRHSGAPLAEEVGHLLESVAARTEEHLANCRFRKKHLTRQEKLVMLPAVAVDSYLDRLKRANCDVFTQTLKTKDSMMPLKIYIKKLKRSF